MKLVEKGASGFKIVGLTRKLPPADCVTVFEALAARRPPPVEAPALLADAYSSVGRFADAVRMGKKAQASGKHRAALLNVGEAALDAGAFEDAEAAFAAIAKPNGLALIGVAVAQKKRGKDPSKALAQATRVNVAKKAIDWKSSTSCSEHVLVAIVEAMILAVRGDTTHAKQTLEAARSRFSQVTDRSVRAECQAQLAAPGDDKWSSARGESTIARHAGL